MEDCLGGEVPLGTAHTINQTVATFCRLPKKDHVKLKASDLLKLKKQAEEGLKWKFVLMKPVLKTTGEIDVDKLKSIYPMSIQIREFHESLCHYDMEDVFMLIPEEFVKNTQGESKPASGARLQSLFSPMSQPTVDNVCKYSVCKHLWTQLYGSEFDMVWYKFPGIL